MNRFQILKGEEPPTEEEVTRQKALSELNKSIIYPSMKEMLEDLKIDFNKAFHSYIYRKDFEAKIRSEWFHKFWCQKAAI